MGLYVGCVDGWFGVWLFGRLVCKVVVIGVWVLWVMILYGFVFNCDCDLVVFIVIVLCGISDVVVIFLFVEFGCMVIVDEVCVMVVVVVCVVLDGVLLVGDCVFLYVVLLLL